MAGDGPTDKGKVPMTTKNGLQLSIKDHLRSADQQHEKNDDGKYKNDRFDKIMNKQESLSNELAVIKSDLNKHLTNAEKVQ